MTTLSLLKSEFEQALSTIESAQTISPKTGMVNLNGAVSVVNIIPPMESFHMILFFIEGLGATPNFNIGGNIQTENNINLSTVGIPIIMLYEPVGKLYYGGVLDPTE